MNSFTAVPSNGSQLPPDPLQSKSILDYGNKLTSPDSGATSDAQSAQQQQQRKEVDYYLNPTELFRWINYRRWDGAKARVLSHPDECSTWIVSRHSSDRDRILWKHLPLHLVCMQASLHSSAAATAGPASPQPATVGSTATQDALDRQAMEDLVHALLDAYPDAANSPDDQGMLPLHLVVANPKPNDYIVQLLLLVYPAAVDVRDKYGRTPLDLVVAGATAKSPTANANTPHHTEHMMKLRKLLLRTQLTTNRLVKALRQENAATVQSLQEESNTERLASQRIIVRLEQELAETRERVQSLEHATQSTQDSQQDLHKTIRDLQQDKDNIKVELQAARRERDELVQQNDMLRNQLQEQEAVMKRMHHNLSEDRQDQHDIMATLKSEVATHKAMSEALEQQLRSRFANEEYMTNNIAELERQLNDVNAELHNQTQSLQKQVDALEKENTLLQRSVDDLTKTSQSLRTKLRESDQHLTTVLSAHGTLNAEHDRVLDSCLRFEREFMETIQHERTHLLQLVQRQLETVQSTLHEQQQLAEEYQQKEREMMELAKEERNRSLDIISELRNNFQKARTSSQAIMLGVKTSGTISLQGNSVQESQQQQQMMMDRLYPPRTVYNNNVNSSGRRSPMDTGGGGGGGDSQGPMTRPSTSTTTSGIVEPPIPTAVSQNISRPRVSPSHSNNSPPTRNSTIRSSVGTKHSDETISHTQQQHDDESVELQPYHHQQHQVQHSHQHQHQHQPITPKQSEGSYSRPSSAPPNRREDNGGAQRTLSRRDSSPIDTRQGRSSPRVAPSGRQTLPLTPDRHKSISNSNNNNGNNSNSAGANLLRMLEQRAEMGSTVNGSSPRDRPMYESSASASSYESTTTSQSSMLKHNAKQPKVTTVATKSAPQYLQASKPRTIEVPLDRYQYSAASGGGSRTRVNFSADAESTNSIDSHHHQSQQRHTTASSAKSAKKRPSRLDLPSIMLDDYSDAASSIAGDDSESIESSSHHQHHHLGGGYRGSSASKSLSFGGGASSSRKAGNSLMIRISEESELDASGSDFTSQRGIRPSVSSRVVRE